jgi:hypothetical protein
VPFSQCSKAPTSIQAALNLLRASSRLSFGWIDIAKTASKDLIEWRSYKKKAKAFAIMMALEKLPSFSNCLQKLI